MRLDSIDDKLVVPNLQYVACPTLYEVILYLRLATFRAMPKQRT